MLPKELFLSTLEKIQKQEARIDEFNTALSKICDGFPVFDSENQYLIALRELLKYTMQDQYDYIGWWLYEAPDAGYTVWWDDEDGKEIRVDTGSGTFDIMGALQKRIAESYARVRRMWRFRKMEYAVNTLGVMAVLVTVMLQVRIWLAP